MPREKDNWDPRAVNLEGRYQTKEKWHDRDGNELHPHTNYYVGGNTKFFRRGAVSLCAKKTSGEIAHHGGLSPAWPISYDDLEPYYTEAERLYHVHGNAGEDPTEPRRSTPYPHPAVSHEPRLQQLSDDFESLGLRPFHTPLGVMLDEKIRTPATASAARTCDGFPCLVYGKSDAQVCAVDPALQNANVALDDGRLRRETRYRRFRPQVSQGHRPSQRQLVRELSGGHRRIFLRRDQFRRAPAALAQRPTSAAVSLTARISSGATTWATSIPC